MRVVGLTGGIASGKSTVAAMLRVRGAPIVDADVLARDVVAVGSDGLAAVVEAFGEDVLAADGSLDRKALGERVFSDPAARGILNRITHPRIAMASQAALAAHREAGAPIAIYEAALIVENKLHASMAALIVVAVDEDTQVARLCARDNIDRDAALARIASQLPLADKIAVADHVIDNSGTVEETEAQVDALWSSLTAPLAEEAS